MITKPETTCPRCGGKLTALEVIDFTRHAESVTYYCECPCGAASLTRKGGKIIDITRRTPIRMPEYEDIPVIHLNEPVYIA